MAKKSPHPPGPWDNPLWKVSSPNPSPDQPEASEKPVVINKTRREVLRDTGIALALCTAIGSASSVALLNDFQRLREEISSTSINRTKNAIVFANELLDKVKDEYENNPNERDDVEYRYRQSAYVNSLEIESPASLLAQEGYIALALREHSGDSKRFFAFTHVKGLEVICESDQVEYVDNDPRDPMTTGMTLKKTVWTIEVFLKGRPYAAIKVSDDEIEAVQVGREPMIPIEDMNKRMPTEVLGSFISNLDELFLSIIPHEKNGRHQEPLDPTKEIKNWRRYLARERRKEYS